ncbi:MAG TPA: FAD-dependent oxidoreductase [Aquabacterium sp.]|uniref:flavin monoamine oxidase family protein n=1 Tax=Aquabacterium sp. TaxID=1872578 RepID=UPI002E3353D3|nr:FAD-dependent oxidoreductase [Aquabacterium sp.]HEX5371495.1 FAD-dependent oxidoreductase [Aquabacterium sp.]
MKRDTSCGHVLDVAIVGGGVSGLYSAWRLLTDSGDAPPTVAVFEGSGRVGGRLLSVTPPGLPQGRVELGGMRYTTGHIRVKSLVDYLGLATAPFAVSEDANVAYLRGHRLRTADLTDAQKLPYVLSTEEQASLSDGMTVLAAQRFLQKVLHQPHVDLNKVPWTELARSGRYEGHLLRDLSMRYVYNRSVSHEAFQFAEDTSGYDSIYFTWNAVDGFPWNLADYGRTVSYERLVQGYATLPETLAERVEAAGGHIHLHTRLTRFDRVHLVDGSPAIELHFQHGEQERVLLARKLILAMPRRSLELLDQSGAVLAPEHRHVHELIESVEPIPLFKLALCYRTRWWEKLGITQGQSVTDLPIRKCYYWPVGDQAQGGAILIYNDVLDMDYWTDLRKHPLKFAQPPDDSGLEPSPWADYPAPAVMVEEAHRQLLIMHGVEDHPDLRPYAAAYRDWGEDPFGGGANFWRQYVESYDVAHRIVQPVPGVAVYICGEAYSHDQGWVEGALATAEDMLQRCLGLPPPPFMPGEGQSRS